MTSWKNKTLAHWELINRMAEKRFGAGSVADEAVVFVVDGLEHDSWKRLQTYAGKASFSTFLRSLVFRLLEDFSRKKYGRVQPPQWLRRLGGSWLLLYRFLCLERLSVEAAVEKCHAGWTVLMRKELEQAAWQILERVTNCRSHQGVEVVLDENIHGSAVLATTPESSLDSRQRQELFSIIFGEIIEEKTSVYSSFSKLMDCGVNITPQERLLLKMKYVDGISTGKIGRLLGLNRHQINGRLRRLLVKLREKLESGGLAAEVIDHLKE